MRECTRSTRNHGGDVVEIDEIPTEWSPLTCQVLRSAGWYPGRAVPVDGWRRALEESHGLHMHEAAASFLAEFGGLATDTWTPGPVMPQSTFRFDPCVAAAQLSQAAGAGLCPIGQADSGASYLGMAVDGSVHVGDTSGSELLASGAHAALERLVMDRLTEAPLPFVPAGDHLELPAEFEATTGPDGVRRWSPATERVLRSAGWRPGRSVSVDNWEKVLREADDGYVMHEAARRFLAEFGGLEVFEKGPGVNAGRASFRLDPALAKWDYEIIESLGEEVEVSLYPLGDLWQGNFYLAMAENGTVYFGMDDAEWLAQSPDEALDRLIRGIRG
ncbi:SUKH-3 domain-containing protein [Streptomyces sp. NPDC048182]|uniref:SUKH-3 domain-containing protein n=1 Tax=Streptomyces sp. NPDC048182 TaxID=3365507 RepID=UPI00371CA10F